jgi:hypothetical protein
VPLLLIPLVLLGVLVLALVMMPVSLVQRYRMGTARRPARGWVATLNVVTFTLSSALFLATAALTSFWVPEAFTYALLGLLAGCALGGAGLWLSQWEATPHSLHYTPNRWLVLAITLIVTSRILYGFWRSWQAWRSMGADPSWLAASGVAGTLAAGAVVLGYYLAYWTGVRWRFMRHRRLSG